MLYELFTSDLELFASNVVERRRVNDDDISYHTADHGSRLDRYYFPDQLVGIFFQEKRSHRSVNVLRVNSEINPTAFRAS